MVVRELLTRLGFQVDSSRLNQYQNATNNIRNSANGAADALRNMFIGFVGIQGLRSLANTADQMQSFEARIGQLPQTIDDAGTAFDAVASRANMARQSIDAYANLYIKLQNAGKDFIKTQEEGFQVTDTLSKALVVGGATAAEQSSAMLQFAQAIGSGVLQGDEMRAMAEAAPQFMDELAKAIGIPRTELKEFAKDGELTSKVVIDAIKKMSVVFDDKFKSMPMTIGQATTIMGNKWDMFIARLNRKSKTVTKIAAFLLEGFDVLEKKLYQAIELLGGAANAIKLFGIALGAALAPGVIWIFTGALTMLLSPAMLIFAAFMAVGLAIDDFNNFVQGNISLLGQWFGSWAEVQAKISELGLIFDFLRSTIIVTGTVLLAMFITATSPVLAFLIIIAGAIALFQNWRWIVAELGKKISQSFADAIAYIKDQINSLDIAAQEVWRSFSNGFLDMIDRLKVTWQSFKDVFTIGGIIGKAIMSPSALINNIYSEIQPISLVRKPEVSNQNITFNQTFAPGSPQEVAQAAKDGAIKGISPLEKVARQAGQVQ